MVRIVLGAMFAATVYAQTTVPARTLVTEAVNNSNLIRLAGNTRPEANAANDRGEVAGGRDFKHIKMLLKRPAEREAALEKYVAQLSDLSSPFAHQWLTAREVGEKFGVSKEDLDTIKRWLESEGFRVNTISPTRNVIDFSGSARQIKAAFHTEIHQLSVHGEEHVGNMSDPKIPAALGDLVHGIVSLNDFRPHPMVAKLHMMDGGTNPDYTTSNGYFLVTPPDLATIYNLNPLFAAGLSGQGQTIALLEDTDVTNPGDWLAFRKRFALAKAYPYATLTQVQPQSDLGETCTDPGVTGDDGEADLDIQWSSAAAPNANIVLASCANTDFNFGGFIAFENMLFSGTSPAIVSLSYGDAETDLGSSFNAYINVLYELAAVEGVSLYVSSGDSGADVYDARNVPATSGINASGFATTPYNVAVGGTDFADSFLGVNSTYWNSTTATNGQSAKSYIPEIPWDSSCASTLISLAFGYPTAYGTNGFCNSALASTDNLLDIVGGSGAPSGCALGDASVTGVVSGNCAGYPKPSWQSLVGVPNDGVRDIPDVSLFAASGIWGHYYLFCYSDSKYGGKPCQMALAGAGGTSFASPIMAGFQALVNQKTGTAWGNPNPVLYSIARAEYGASGSASCNSTLGNGVSSACVFYDVTLGDNNIVCAAGSPNCYAPSGAYGVLSASTTSFKPAFPTTTGWDFATGIGTVNGFNLVSNWLAGAAAASSAPQ